MSTIAGNGGFTLGTELDPGTYTSTAFATPVTFTVPAGWKVFEDQRGQFGLARMANDGPPLLVLRDVRAAAQDCTEGAEPGVGFTAEEFTSWLSDLEGLQTTDPVSVTVGGLDGMITDIVLDPEWPTTCPFYDEPVVSVMVGTEISSGLFWGIDATEEQRYWILDLPQVSGGNVVIMADACCGVDPQDQIRAAQQVVDSFLFDE